MISAIKGLEEPNWNKLKPEMKLTGKEDATEKESMYEDLKAERSEYYRQKRYQEKKRSVMCIL